MPKKKWNPIETRNGVEGRVCIDCGSFKSIDLFGKLKGLIPRGDCKECQGEYNRAYLKKYYIENRDAVRKQQAKKYKDYIAKQRDAELLIAAKYPPTPTCEICNDPPKSAEKRLAFDHNHITNEFRGWLCNRCNMALGMCRDNPEILIKMAAYLTERGNYSKLFYGEQPKKRRQPWQRVKPNNDDNLSPIVEVPVG